MKIDLPSANPGNFEVKTAIVEMGVNKKQIAAVEFGIGKTYLTIAKLDILKIFFPILNN
jgi:hypothetical protein